MKSSSTGLFLPTSKKEMEKLEWDQADIILFTGDAYIDHPSFGAAVIGRVLERAGFRVAIVPQPNWRDDLRDFKKLGEPRLFFAVTSGSMDSMVNHYTANKRLRSDDAYTPDGKAGYRPDYATTVYSNILKKLYPHTPIVLGGIEASLRRLTHYDYWSDSLFPSILVNSKADLLVYGMGEKAIVEIATLMDKGASIGSLTNIPQTAFYTNSYEPFVNNSNTLVLNSFEECQGSKKAFGDNFARIEVESNSMIAKRIIEPTGEGAIVVNSAYLPPTTGEMDSWWDLPYMRAPHPRYNGKGTIPAWEMIKHSINIHRGCFGGCSFCTISAHQGKFISSRSEESILKEAEQIAHMPDFKGYLSDIGGPSANMYCMQGKDLSICKKCKRYSCIHPSICKNLDNNHEHLLDLYQKVRSLNFIKKAFIGSGIRYDMFIDSDLPANKRYLDEVFRHHVSGRLKVAPEHTEDEVLKMMRKPPFNLFSKLKVAFDELNIKYSLNQQLIPYFISSHPGSTEQSMKRLAERTKALNFKLEQVQDFTPTPMTLASTIFYTGVDPYTGESVFVAKSKDDKLKQRSHFFWYKKSDNFRKEDVKSKPRELKPFRGKSGNKNRGQK